MICLLQRAPDSPLASPRRHLYFRGLHLTAWQAWTLPLYPISPSGSGERAPSLREFSNLTPVLYSASALLISAIVDYANLRQGTDPYPYPTSTL